MSVTSEDLKSEEALPLETARNILSPQPCTPTQGVVYQETTGSK
jgi:hypothetical protein